jgi:hypothetical protein
VNFHEILQSPSVRAGSDSNSATRLDRSRSATRSLPSLRSLRPYVLIFNSIAFGFNRFRCQSLSLFLLPLYVALTTHLIQSNFLSLVQRELDSSPRFPLCSLITILERLVSLSRGCRKAHFRECDAALIGISTKLPCLRYKISLLCFIGSMLLFQMRQKLRRIPTSDEANKRSTSEE